MQLEKLDFDLLKKMAKDLNSAVHESGKAFLEKKIKAVAVTKQGLAEAFDAAVQGIDPDIINDLPEPIIDFYNANFAVEDTTASAAAEAEPEKKEEEAPPAKEEKKKAEKAKKEPKPAKEKKPKKEVELSCFGHQVGSQAAKLDDLLAPGKPISLKDLSDKSGRSPLGVKSHIKHLQEVKKLTITEKDGTYQLVIKK